VRLRPRRRVPLEISEEIVAAALPDLEPEHASEWYALPEAKRLRYLDGLCELGGDPPELVELLGDASAREAWGRLPWLAQRDWCRWINEGRTQRKRRKRARFVLDGAARIGGPEPSIGRKDAVALAGIVVAILVFAALALAGHDWAVFVAIVLYVVFLADGLWLSRRFGPPAP
jgi:hypothetical protein